MTPHGLWLDIILSPHLLDQQFINGLTESEIFDLLVHLINNGINLMSSLNQNNVADEIKKNIENKKYNIIRFLVFKVLAHFQWDLEKILNILPTVHQEFVFAEFKRFCEQKEVPIHWKNFSFMIYHQTTKDWHYIIKPTTLGSVFCFA